jgi:hypothetical protein
MINPLIKYYLIPLVLLIACSCESDVDMVILPEFKQKPVITAFISPSDAVLKVAVSSNKKIYGELNSEFKFSNLKCFLADDSSEKELDTCAGGFCMLSSNMPIIAGRKYRLRMTADNDISAEAECTIPANRHFSLRVDTFTKLINTGYGILSKQYLRIIFNDNPDESNYYRLFGSYESYGWNPNTGSLYHYERGFEIEKEFFSDQGWNGMEYQTDINYSAWADSVVFRIYLLNTEQAYYLYHRSIIDYNWMGDPFSEPTPIYSNVKGGLGIFTSYTVDSLRVKF